MATIAHRPKLALLALAGSAIALIALWAVVARTPTRASVLAELSRPAVQLRAGGVGFKTTVHRGDRRITLALALNRAGLADPVRVTLAGRDGRPIASARVTLTYSMPSMRMWNVYSSRLTPLAHKPGGYVATEGVLGMPGAWRIAVAVAMPGAGPTRFAVLDRMGP